MNVSANLEIAYMKLALAMLGLGGIFLSATVQLRERTRRRLQRALEEQKVLTDEAEAANMVKTSFLANMSHELRTPLNAIMGFSEMIQLQIKGKFAKVYEADVAAIHDSASHLHELLGNVLDVTKADSKRLKLQENIFSFDDVMDQAVSLVMLPAEEKGLVITEVEKTGIYLCGDAIRIKQVVLNVLTNAVRYSDSGEIRVDISRTPDVFEVIVRDQGIGMTNDQIAIAMKPFTRSNPDQYTASRGGTGLGLPLSLELIELHGCSLRIESAEGKGTAVLIRIPASRIRNRVQYKKARKAVLDG